MSEIRLSIIIPYYNADAWIGKMLDSLLDQNLPKGQYEIIIIDDGSTQSQDTLLYYTQKNSNIIVFHQENNGPSAARNTGIGLARGKWLYLCDSDDFVQPKVLGKLLDIADTNDLEMLICNWCVVAPDTEPQNSSELIKMSNIYSGWQYLSLFSTNPMGVGFGVWRYIIKKETIIKNVIRFEDLTYVEDRIFQLDLFRVVKRIAYTDVMLYYYVQHEESIMHNKKKRNYLKYIPWLWKYIDKLTGIIQDPIISEDVKTVLEGHRDFAIFSLLGNSIKYCPISSTKETLVKLKTIDGAYPIQTTGASEWIRMARKLMNHPHLWLLGCRLFHFFPLRIRQLF